MHVVNLGTKSPLMYPNENTLLPKVSQTSKMAADSEDLFTGKAFFTES